MTKATIDNGHHGATSEGLDEAHALDLRALRQAWAEGVASGDAGPVDMAALRAEARRRLAAAVGSESDPATT